MSETETKSPPRVVVELHDDGIMAIEYHLNGARTRTVLYRGMEFLEIVEALHAIRRERATLRERKLEREEAQAVSRHRKVWTGVAINHGVVFANRTVGAKNSLTTRPQAGAATPKSKAKADAKADAITSSVDLL